MWKPTTRNGSVEMRRKCRSAGRNSLPGRLPPRFDRSQFAAPPRCGSWLHCSLHKRRCDLLSRRNAAVSISVLERTGLFCLGTTCTLSRTSDNNGDSRLKLSSQDSHSEGCLRSRQAAACLRLASTRKPVCADLMHYCSGQYGTSSAGQLSPLVVPAMISSIC